jgi:hypothetical protein
MDKYTLGLRRKVRAIRNFIDTEIAKIEADERYHYTTASVSINAPLALIQVGMENKMVILRQLKELLDQP